METNDSIRFNQIRNYKRCFADAIKVITHLPFNLIRSLCLLWGLSSIGIFGLICKVKLGRWGRNSTSPLCVVVTGNSLIKVILLYSRIAGGKKRTD